MTQRVEVYKPFLTSGQVYIRNAATPTGPRYPIGNVSELKLVTDEEVIEQKDFTSPGGGTHAEVRRISSVTASMILHDLNADNLALALRGSASSVVAGTITDEAHTAYAGSLIRLAHPGPADVVVTSAVGDTTYNDYEVRAEGVFVHATGDIATAAAADGVDVKIAYKHEGYTAIETLTTGGANWEISFGGINEADSNKPVLVDLWKVSLGVTNELGLITDALGSVALEGKCLKDPTKGAGKSAYCRVQQV